MVRIATHADPVRRPVPAFLLRAVVDDLDGPDGVEQLWTERVGETSFRLCCIPFFVYDLALGDVVHADPAGGWWVDGVESRSGNGLARVAVVRPEDDAVLHEQLHELVAPTSYLYEWNGAGYVAINVEPGRSTDELFAGLAAFGDRVQVERILL